MGREVTSLCITQSSPSSSFLFLDLLVCFSSHCRLRHVRGIVLRTGIPTTNSISNDSTREGWEMLGFRVKSSSPSCKRILSSSLRTWFYHDYTSCWGPLGLFLLFFFMGNKWQATESAPQHMGRVRSARYRWPRNLGNVSGRNKLYMASMNEVSMS